MHKIQGKLAIQNAQQIISRKLCILGEPQKENKCDASLITKKC